MNIESPTPGAVPSATPTAVTPQAPIASVNVTSTPPPVSVAPVAPVGAKARKVGKKNRELGTKV